MTSRPRRRKLSETEWLQRQYERLRSLFDLATDLRADEAPDELCARAANGLRELLPATAVLIWQLGPQRRLSIISASGADMDEEAVALLRQLQVRSGEGVVGQMLATNTQQILEGADAHRASYGALGRRRENLYRRLREYLPEQFDTVAIGMYDQRRLQGVIEIFVTQQFLTLEELEPLQSFANRLASALSISRLYSELSLQRTRLAAFDAVVTAISSATGLQELLSLSLLVVINLVSGTGGGLLLVDPNGERLMLAIEHAMPEDEQRLLDCAPLSGGPLEDAAIYGQPTTRQLDEQPEVARAVIPLLVGGTITGMLVLYGPGERMTPEQLNWSSLMAIGNQIATAIANTQLYNESQRERSRLNSVIASMADGVVICDQRGQVVLANEAASNMLGLSALAPESTPFDPLSEGRMTKIDGQPLEPDDAPLSIALRGETFHDLRLVVKLPVADKVFSFSGSPLRTGEDPTDPEGAVLLFRDITEQRRLEVAKDEFLAVTAHELRSPLASIKGYADLLLRRELKRGSEEREVRGVRFLTQQVDHLVRLVDNLLDLSRLDAGRLTLYLEEINVIQMVDQTLNQMRTLSPEHTFTLQTEHETLLFKGDAVRLRQVVTNLLSNAMRYSKPGTQISARVWQEPRQLLIAVDDQGPGIPSLFRERLFNRYTRVPGIERQGPGGEGLGLGLYLAREIVMLHGGRIWVEDSESGGASFVMMFPLPDVAETDDSVAA